MEEKKQESLLEKIKRHDAEFDEQIKKMTEEIEELKKKVFRGKYKKVEESGEEIAREDEEVSVVSEKQESWLEKIKKREAWFDEQSKQLDEEIQMLKKKILRGRDKKVEEVSSEITEPSTKRGTFIEEIERHAVEFDEKMKKMREEIEIMANRVFRKRDR
jgi:archaellum component FlaC